MRVRATDDPQTLDKEQHHSLYEDFKKKGESFWPFTIFEDVVVSLLVLIVLLLLAVFAGVPHGKLADPTNTAYVPRPEWYFMALFQILKIFPGYLEWVGVVVVPAIGILVLMLLPFYDRGPKRHPARRPLALTIAGLAVVGIVVLTVMAFRSTPTVSEGEGWETLTSIEQVGSTLFRAQGCTSCHNLAGEGNLAGVPLDGVGSRLDENYLHSYIANPSLLNPDSPMPSFLGPLSHSEIDAIAKFLVTHK